MAPENLMLAVVLFAAAYAWRRSGFWLPRWLPVPIRTRGRLLAAGGCVVLVVLLGVSAGEIIEGRAALPWDHPRYASRTAEPREFWAKVLPHIAVGLALGGGLIAFGLAGLERPVRPRA